MPAVEAFADIRRYCDFDSMLQDRLDKEKAIVMISHNDRQEPSATPVLTIDSTRKVSESSVTQMVDNMREEAELLTPQEHHEKLPSSIACPQEASPGAEIILSGDGRNDASRGYQSNFQPI